jgi:hypothetical protein
MKAIGFSSITQSTLNSSKQSIILLMRQKSEAVNDQLDENPIAFIVVASSIRLSLIKLYFLFVVILTDVLYAEM